MVGQPDVGQAFQKTAPTRGRVELRQDHDIGLKGAEGVHDGPDPPAPAVLHVERDDSHGGRFARQTRLG